MKPYKEKIISENRVVRTFKNDVEEGELTWHRDREDRIVFPINENDWFFQEDDSLPVKMQAGEPIIIESGVFHRILKGSSDLELEIFKVNLDDEENVKTNINEIFTLFLEKSKNKPTNKKLWNKALRLARGKKHGGSKTVRHDDETHTAPNNGKGFGKYPSAYANSYASKKYKKWGGKWKKINEEIEDSNEDLNEDLRDWHKEEWVRIDTQGNIAGECGTMPDGKRMQRCLPKKKAQSLSKEERKSTVAKKTAGDKKGKQFVQNTEKAKVTKKDRN
jgi:hypothetical protein